MTSTAESENSKRLRSSSLERVPRVLGATRDVTVARRGTEEAGDASAAKLRIGDEDDEVATAA